jgi:hypothetical protein
MKQAEQQSMSPTRIVVGKVEQFFKKFITGGNKFNAFCDSRINLCYYCCQLRIKARRQRPPFFTIFTKFGAYTFLRFPDSPKITLVTQRNGSWSLVNLKVSNDKISAETT